MKFAMILCLLVSASCSSNLVRGVGKQSKYAPKSHSELGLVEYLNAGGGFVKEARRESAYKTMYENCNGNYEIVKEGPKNYSGDTWEIYFRCSPVATSN